VEKTTTIRLNPNKVARAAEVLGTKGLKPTVDAALDEVLGKQAWAELKQMMADGIFELSSEEVRRRAWR
jgi:Arc/MetJ family transcription regulator